MNKTPKLRFKEFSGDWETGIISDFGYFYYGKSAPKWSVTEDATTPCIRYGELYTIHKELVREINTYTNIPKENLRFSKGGEVLIPRVGEKPLDFAKCTYLPFKDVAIGEMISVYNTSKNPLFIVYYFRSKMKYEFARMVEGGNVSNLYYSYLEKIPVNIPGKEEQEKIASFFSLIDDKISLQSEKLDMLKDYKKGMMQKIFSRKLRFKDDEGRDYPEWEEKKIGQTLKIKHGKDQKQIQVEDGVYPILATGGEIGRTNTPLYDKESVLIGRKGTIDRPFYMSTPFWTVDTLFYSEIKEDMFAKFIYYKFQNINWKKYSEASGVPSLSASTIENLKYNVPSKEEQEKIANFLSILDEKINKEQEKLDSLNEYKKGLSQQMFI